MNKIGQIAVVLALAFGAVACGQDPGSMADDSGSSDVTPGGTGGAGGGNGGAEPSSYVYPADVVSFQPISKDAQGDWTCPSHRRMPGASIVQPDGACQGEIVTTTGSRTVYGMCWGTVCCPGCWDGKTCRVDAKLWTDSSHYPTYTTPASSCQ